MKMKSLNNKILYLTRPNGMIIDDLRLICLHFIWFYKDLFGRNESFDPPQMSIKWSGPTLDDEDRDMMVATIWKEEVKVALFDIEDDKARSPKNYSAALFKST